MSSWWSALRERLAIVRAAERRGQTALFVRGLSVALLAPLLVRLPPARLDAFLEWCVAGAPPSSRVDPDALAFTVLEALRAGRPIVQGGCLTRGLTLYYCLRRVGVDVALSFGMGRVPQGDGFEGHCWLVLGGEPYLEPRDPRCDYATTYTFGRGTTKRAACASLT